MPRKRYSDEDIEAYVSRKMRKIEKKLKKRRRQRASSQDSLRSLDEPPRSNSFEARFASPELPRQSIETTQNTDSPNEVIVVVPHNEIGNVTSEHQNDTPLNVPSEPVASAVTDQEVLTIGNNEAEDILPDDILEILGEAPLKDKRFGPALNSSLAVRWEHTATNGLSKDIKKDIFEKYYIPENCKNIEAPTFNQEVKAALSEVLNKKDKAIENKQKQIALIITCLGDALSHVLSTDNTNLKLVKSLTDAGKLACDLQHTESMTRRSFVCSSIKKEIKDHLYKTQIDTYLFGSQLGDILKSAKAINKTGEEMKTGASTPGSLRRFVNKPHLNTRRPLPLHGRQTGAAARRPAAPAPNARPEHQRQQRRALPPQQQPRGPYRRSQTQAPHRR